MEHTNTQTKHLEEQKKKKQRKELYTSTGGSRVKSTRPVDEWLKQLLVSVYELDHATLKSSAVFTATTLHFRAVVD